MGKYRALAEIRGEPMPKRKKTREELNRAERRRRKERAKSMGYVEPRRLVKRGKKAAGPETGYPVSGK
jgi:hypothetical protein